MRKAVGIRVKLLSTIGLGAALIGLPASASGSRAGTSKNHAIAAAPSQPWAQLASDVQADPNVRFGMLPNGLRYAILKNATPPGQASLRVRIDAGSLMEREDQLGLAHFMEHMAFNGTTHLPENELLKVVARLGVAFGADLNAATGFDQTFYMLDLPKADETTLSTGLHVLREQVSEATIYQKDIVDERGVIHGEERLRNSPAIEIFKKELRILARGQKMADRLPIGDMKIIDTAPRQRFVDYYNSYYRPSRATVIAIGDFDVDRTEAKIRAYFGDWRAKAPDGPEPDLGTVAARGPETHLFVEKTVPSSVSLSWINAPDLRPDTMAKRREKLIQMLALAVLNRRLDELTRTDSPPFVAASANRGNANRSLRLVGISAQFVPGRWKEALHALDQEQRRFAVYGVTQAELDREITSMKTDLQNAVAEAGTRETRTLAFQLLNSINDREVFTSPQTDLAYFQDTIAGLTAEKVNAVARTLFQGEGPINDVLSATPIEGGETAVAAALNAERQLAVAAPVPPEKPVWPYTEFGPAGAVLSRTELAGLGITKVEFANGVVLLVKPTKFDKDQIMVSVLSGIGDLNFGPDKLDARRDAMNTLVPGGLGKLTVDDMTRTLNGHVVSFNFGKADNRFLFSGNTRNEDLRVQMEVLAALVTDPAFRTAPFDRVKVQYPMMLPIFRGSPGGAFSLCCSVLRAGGDKRQAIWSAEEVASWPELSSMRNDLKDMVRRGPVAITMVGDMTVEDAISATARTFGALPPFQSAPPPPPGATERHFPRPTAAPLHFTHDGLAEQALGHVEWPSTDKSDMKEYRRVELLNAVLKLRVLDEIRERLALAYSPHVGFQGSDAFRGYGSIEVEAETSPAKLAAFFAAVDRIAAGLQEKPVSADEIKRAREPLVQKARRSLNGNGYWSGILQDIAIYPDRAKDELTEEADLEAITPADIQALAQKYLRPETAWRAEVTPSVLEKAPEKVVPVAAAADGPVH